MSLKKLKTICVMELGGTISCITDDPTSEFYHAVHHDIAKLIEQISIESNIKIEIQNAFKVISHEISIQNLIDIGRLIQNQLDSKKYDGIVITMGTNALEDVAYFIDLVIDTTIPIIITGAHYPQNSLSFDGTRNLYNAVKIASSKEAIALGVLVTFGDYVVSAREATKTMAGLPPTFINPVVGAMGYIIGGQFVLRSKPIYRRPNLKDFNLESLNSSIKVAVIYGHLGMDDSIVNAMIESGTQGIVSAGFGKGYQPSSITNILKEAVSRGIIVVRCPRSNLGYSGVDPKYDKENGFIISNGLSVNKVAILLFVALNYTRDFWQLNEMFEVTK